MIPFSVFLRKLSYLPMLAVLTLATGATVAHAQNAVPQPSNVVSPQPKPVPLAHLYLNFLLHQNQLDALAASRETRGLDGKPLRNHMQASLGFSDEDYAPIRTSSKRLGAEVTALDAQAKAFRSDRLSSHFEDLKALASQREAYLNAEINYLTMALSPQNKAALEAFMTQFFAPKVLTVKPSTIGQLAPAEVQK